MEIAFDPAVPTYSGGLGILAGDTLRAAADLGVQSRSRSCTGRATSGSALTPRAARWTNRMNGA
jgi:hypothetical protein